MTFCPGYQKEINGFYSVYTQRKAALFFSPYTGPAKYDEELYSFQQKERERGVIFSNYWLGGKSIF